MNIIISLFTVNFISFVCINVYIISDNYLYLNTQNIFHFQLQFALNLKMKEGLRKLKGSSFPSDIGEIELIDIFRQQYCEFDQLYFSTQHQNLIAKVYNLSSELSQERFRHQEQVYLQGKYLQLAEHAIIEEIQIKKKNYGVLLLKIAKNSFLQQIYTSLNHNDWLSLIQTVLDFTEKLKQQRQVFLNINPWSIARNADGDFKILDAQFLTNQGSYQQLSENNYILVDICEKQYLYRSPELLDQYSKCKIDYNSDLFSFATVLYQLIYHQYPFDSKLSQINSYYRSVEENSFFTDLVTMVLKPYQKRAKLEQLRQIVENQRKKIPKEPTTKNMSSGSTNQSKSSSIFSGLTQMFSKLTTETQGWYLSFTENDQNAPQEKYSNLLIHKLYKKQTKLQKLISIIMKYIEASSKENRENQITKTLLLMLILFRRGPNTMNYQWQQIITTIENRFSQNIIISQLSKFCKQKISINSILKTIFRGNFFIDDLNKFKNVTPQLLDVLYCHVIWVIDSINSKLLFSKNQNSLIDFTKSIYCDEILDCISMLIFSCICIRKDNQLQIRKDNLSAVSQIQKKLNNVLKKISHLSNHVNGHAIYSLESQFFYYQQQIQLRQSPFYSSLQHFYKNFRQYKGLCIPQNYSFTYCSGEQKEFLSSENNRNERQKSQPFKDKTYFEEIDSDGQKAQSLKVIQSPQKPKNNKKEQFLQKLNLERSLKKEPQKNDLFLNIPPKPKKAQPTKTVTFDQFFNLQLVKQGSNTNKKQIPEVKIANVNKQQNKAQDFTFFEAFTTPQQPKKEEINQKPNSNNSFFELFGNIPKQKQQKTTKQKNIVLSNSNSQKLIQQNTPDWLKKSGLAPSQINKKQFNNELLNYILSGLKLKQLKEIITNNQQIIIDFNKLKLQKVIGSGSAGEVYLGKYEGQTLAIKKVKTKQNPNALKQFERQLLTYIKIKRNPYLVSLVGLSKSQQNYYLLTQFCNSGSLFDLLHKRANITPLSWRQRIQLATEIAKGMLALHQMKPPIIHRDLKSLNVFVIQNNGKFTAKVADFGLSRSPQAEMMTMYLGTLHWMAPELLDNKQYSIKVDVYSYAVVLWQICARKTPYNELSAPMAIIKHVTIEKKRPNMSVIPPDCPPQLIELMTKCWSHEANDRPSFTEIISCLSKIQIFC